MKLVCKIACLALFMNTHESTDCLRRRHLCGNHERYSAPGHRSRRHIRAIVKRGGSALRKGARWIAACDSFGPAIPLLLAE